MNTFKIYNKHTGIFLGAYDANKKDVALDKLAKDAGYANYTNLLENVPNANKQDLEIYEIE